MNQFSLENQILEEKAENYINYVVQDYDDEDPVKLLLEPIVRHSFRAGWFSHYDYMNPSLERLDV